MSKKSQPCKGEMTRERIIAAAAPIFNQRGFAGSSMSDVMEATGLEKGGIYRHFATKEDLAAEAYRYAAGQAIGCRVEGLDTVPGAAAKLRLLVDRFVDVPSPVKGGCPILNTAIDADDGNPKLRALVRETVAGWKKRLSNIVDNGKLAGELRTDLDAAAIANTIVALLEGSQMISRIERSRKPLEDARTALHGLIDGFEAS